MIKSQLIPITIYYSVWPGKESQFGLNDKKVWKKRGLKKEAF